jgi:hypothetical protein
MEKDCPPAQIVQGGKERGEEQRERGEEQEERSNMETDCDHEKIVQGGKELGEEQGEREEEQTTCKFLRQRKLYRGNRPSYVLEKMEELCDCLSEMEPKALLAIITEEQARLGANNLPKLLKVCRRKDITQVAKAGRENHKKRQITKQAIEAEIKRTSTTQPKAPASENPLKKASKAKDPAAGPEEASKKKVPATGPEEASKKKDPAAAPEEASGKKLCCDPEKLAATLQKLAQNKKK